MLKHIAPIAIHFAVEAKHLLPWPFDKLNGRIKVHKTLQICTRETEYFKTGGTRYTEFKFPAKIVMAFSPGTNVANYQQFLNQKASGVNTKKNLRLALNSQLQTFSIHLIKF